MPNFRTIRNMSQDAIDGRIDLAKEVLLDAALPVSFKNFEDYNQFNTSACLMVQMLILGENEAAIDVFVDLLRSDGGSHES